MKNKELRDMTLTYAYEGSKVAGVYNMITFVHTGFSHPYANVIKKHFLTFDYIPKYMSNSIDERTGSINPPQKSLQNRVLRTLLTFQTYIGISIRMLKNQRTTIKKYCSTIRNFFSI